jgi:glycosyltransferase involved in cell wall biosynthesis
MKDLISVIIPFYKVPGIRLRYCIDSLLCQSYKNFELIIVDDGNAMNDYEDIFSAYEKKDSRIRFVHQENSGVSEARNNGINQSKGQYIVFCDSDDFVESNFLENLYHNILGNDIAICGIAEQWFPVTNSRVDFQYFTSKPSLYNWSQYVNFSVNKIYKKSIIDNHNIRFDTKMKMGEDALFISSYLKHCKYIKCISGNLYHYLWNDFSAMHKYNEKFWDNEKFVIKEQYALFHSYSLSKQENDFMEHWLYVKFKDAFYYYLRMSEDKNETKKYIKDILEYDLFKKLVNSEIGENKLFNINDKIILHLWKYFGVQGVFYMNYGSKIKRRI